MRGAGRFGVYVLNARAGQRFVEYVHGLGRSFVTVMASKDTRAAHARRSRKTTLPTRSAINRKHKLRRYRSRRGTVPRWLQTVRSRNVRGIQFKLSGAESCQRHPPAVWSDTWSRFCLPRRLWHLGRPASKKRSPCSAERVDYAPGEPWPKSCARR